MLIMGVGTAVPGHKYTQQECYEALLRSELYSQLTDRSRALLRRVLSGKNGIETRYLALDALEDAFVLTPDAMQARFEKTAPVLATRAAERALENAGVGAKQIGALLVSTCTGYVCPGLTSYVSEKLGLCSNALLLDLVGQGCGAAVPNLRTAEALVASGRAEHVLSVCVEVASAAIYLDNDPGVLISACLFGDGAGAAVLGNDERGGSRRLEWRGAWTRFSPEHRDKLRFTQRAGMLRNVLAAEVPTLAAASCKATLMEGLGAVGLGPQDVSAWIFHPGGRDILKAICQLVPLRDQDVHWSSEVLREFGNVSSPSLFFVLQKAVENGAPPGYWWLSSFGAGFACHGALLEVN